MIIMTIVEFLSIPGFLWLLGVGFLVEMFKPVGLVIEIMVNILSITFMLYWNRKGDTSMFVKVLGWMTLVVTDIAVAVFAFETWDATPCALAGECGTFSYMVTLILAPVISICFYLLLMKLILKLAHKISLLIITNKSGGW